MMFCQRASDDQVPSVCRYIQLRRDGSDTVSDVKAKVAVRSTSDAPDQSLQKIVACCFDLE